MADQGQEAASPRDKLTSQRTTQPAADQTEENAPAAFRDVFSRLSETPGGVDPACWPVQVLNELNYMILHREYATPGRLNVWGVSTREVGERFAPYNCACFTQGRLRQK